MERFIQNYCDVCKRHFNSWEPIIIKVPERIYFCLDCADKKPDNKNLWRLCTEYVEWSVLVSPTQVGCGE